MTDPVGDAIDLIASIGDPERFTPVFERHFDAVHGYIARRAGSEAADELAAEVFCIAFERRHSFDDGHDDARPWLFGIAGRLLQRRWRSGERRGRAVDRLRGSSVVTSNGSEVSDRIEGEETAAAIAAALDELTDDDRETLLLFSWERLTYDQIADALCIPVGTVRSRISRARGRLRAALASASRDDAGLTSSGHPSTSHEGLMT